MQCVRPLCIIAVSDLSGNIRLVQMLLTPLLTALVLKAA